MIHNILRIGLIAATLVVAAGCGRERAGDIDLRLRGKVDSYNKTSFVNRYQDAQCAIHEAYDALALLRDSLPQYGDGYLRAYNNLAFEYYMLAEHDSASAYVDSVLMLTDSKHHSRLCRNAEVERVIAQLMQIRLLQRSCRIADSYQLLYDIDHSRVLRHAPDNYLYSYAQMEYYITSLTLNYHYRNSAVASSSGTVLNDGTRRNMHHLLAEVEEARSNLKCDYAEDLSLNYAIAHSYYRLASANGGEPRMLSKAYQYLIQNLKILAIPNQLSTYHLANVYQLQAFIVADTNIPNEAFAQHCCHELHVLDSLSHSIYPQDSLYWVTDYGLAMFQISTDLFFQTSDPYQHLGAVVAAAEYCLQQDYRDEAYNYYSRALADTTWHDGMAPKFESMLCDGLIRMGYSTSPDDIQRWYLRQIDLLSFIRQNESADVLLQNRLFQSQNRNRLYFVIIVVSLAALIALSALLVLLRRRELLLRREKHALQEAKRQDVERIANVETCLSVLRHDINPFLSYLTNPKLNDEMRHEVLEQLLRTFANIKNWTNLSIPSGLQFQLSTFPLNEVFISVSGTCANLQHKVRLSFHNTPLMLSGDRQLVEILLRNLVNNALQHTTEGHVDITATPYPDDSRFVLIDIADTGCGMDHDTVDNLFRADKQVQPDTDADHGTGFGLILCKYIIKRHDDNTLRGCRIWVDSQKGQGTTVHCLLAKGETIGTD